MRLPQTTLDFTLGEHLRKDHGGRPKGARPQGMCLVCGVRKQQYHSTYKGTKHYKRRCKGCEIDRKTGKSGYRQHVKDTCERCGFVAVAFNQMDVHHRNENHDDNRPENLETLCANCHRLIHAKSFIIRDLTA